MDSNPTLWCNNIIPFSGQLQQGLSYMKCELLVLDGSCIGLVKVSIKMAHHSDSHHQPSIYLVSSVYGIVWVYQHTFTINTYCTYISHILCQADIGTHSTILSLESNWHISNSIRKALLSCPKKTALNCSTQISVTSISCCHGINLLHC